MARLDLPRKMLRIRRNPGILRLALQTLVVRLLRHRKISRILSFAPMRWKLSYAGKNQMK